MFKVNGSTGVVIFNVTRGTNFQMLYGVGVLSSSSNPFVTGVQCAATSQSCNIVTSQLNATTGAQVSTTTYNAGEPLGYFSEIGWGVRLGTDSLPVMTGVSCLATGCDFRTIKYTSTTMGTVSWNQVYNSGGANMDAALGGDIAIANDNRSVITGSSCTVDYPNCVGRIRKLNTTGAVMWDVLDGGATTALQAIATGPDANPVVTGYECTGRSLLDTNLQAGAPVHRRAPARRSTWRSTVTATLPMARGSVFRA